eukprot:TRINITY_DN13315_c0_g1_i6.p1 TRINITY_DN13315_c0_g1~~TRINITY_DN13315_c0_g1_i6.p1  ORF type:complete len:209 (-),score=77.44 TRINITY_DN13315_c0_g1_i6:91-717(-)
MLRSLVGSEMCIRDSLTAPRIRLAPNELEEKFELIEQLHLAAGAQSVTPQPRVLNLCHQSLGDAYQYDCLRAFLRMNATIETLNLDGNELEDITDLHMPNVKKLYISENNFATFSSIPDMPNLEELYMKRNFITSTLGLSSGKFPRLKKICIFANPYEAKRDYRDELVKCLPTLIAIDFYSLSLIHISEPTRLLSISYAVFCLKKKKK